MKISSVLAAGCLSLALGASTSTAQQTSLQAPSTGGTQAGSGTGVNTDPGTQRTTDRAGQTPRPAGTNPGTPSGSLGGDQNSSGGTKGGTGVTRGTTGEPSDGGDQGTGTVKSDRKSKDKPARPGHGTRAARPGPKDSSR